MDEFESSSLETGCMDRPVKRCPRCHGIKPETKAQAEMDREDRHCDCAYTGRVGLHLNDYDYESA